MMALSIDMKSRTAPREERLTQVGEMTSDLVHDLKNMLTGIRGAAELLAVKSGENQFLNIILTQTEAMQRMAEEVMDFARGEEQLAPQTVDVTAFLAELVVAHGENFRRAGIEIALEANCRPACFDRTKLQRALLNLLVNARDAMPQGGRIVLRAWNDLSHLRFEVEDEGVGMTPETAARLCEPFFTAGKERGNGLGGAVVKAVAEAHGGRVEVHSELGRGSCVAIVLPLSAGPSAAPASRRQPVLSIV
jgi:signal transduction histidine kinase